MTVQLSQTAEEERRRRALVKWANAFFHRMPMEGWSHEDAILAWAIRLAHYEGRPVDLRFLMETTRLSRATIQRRLAGLLGSGSLAVSWDGKRKHYALTPLADRQATETEKELLNILDRLFEETPR
jgi:hypothetical protein